PSLFPKRNADSVKDTSIKSLWVYDFYDLESSKRIDQESKHTIYYFAGGGFQTPPSSEHWKFCAHLASCLPSSRLILVSYPLAPHSPARDSLPLLRRWLTQALRESADEGGTVTLVGDSSGANIALSLGLWSQDSVDCYRCLRSVLVISPPTDMHEVYPAVDAPDLVLGKEVADAVAEVWCAGADRTDPYLSPIFADLGNLCESGIEIDGVIGTADVLAPDALKFLESCRGKGVKGSWLVWDGQMHCFPLAACYGLWEGREARNWVVDRLR
ncbi:hypothetical protein M426DRAFT_35953, partial [Hypoxylon sp. CI-4A]